MNRFLKKVKDGASKASEKAKHVMELNRVQSQIDARLKEWKDNTYDIGILAFEAYKNDNFSELKGKLEELAINNLAIEQEIDQLEWKRCELRNEKRCECGEVAPWEANYCSKCGAKLPEPPSFKHETAVAASASAANAVQQSNRWDVQELRPYRHNDSHSNVTADQEPAEPIYMHEGTSHEDEVPLTWRFPEKQTLSRSNRRQAEMHKTCSQCGAQAELDAKWCERCGTPFV